MEVAVISDLHINPDENITDQFQHDDYDFLKFLRFLECNFEKIILLGDIYETLMPIKFGNNEEQLKTCFNKHKEIFDKFNSEKYIYVHGNHDFISQKILKTPELFIIKENIKIIFQHGHQFDLLVKKARIISETGVWIGGIFLRNGLKSLYDYFSKIKEPPNNLTLAEKFAIKQNYDYDVIVTGHTHIAKKIELTDKTYLNSGSCSRGAFNFLSINSKKYEFKVNKTW